MQQTQTHFKPGDRAIGWRIYGVPLAEGIDATSGSGAYDWNAVCRRAADLGFDSLSVPLERLDAPAMLRACVAACAKARLRLVADCPPEESRGESSTRLEAFLEALSEQASDAALLLRGLGGLNARSGCARLEALRHHDEGLGLTIWSPGMTPEQLVALEGASVDGVFSSLPWWDFRAAWLVEEYERLRAVAPVIAPLDDPRRSSAADVAAQADIRRLLRYRLGGP